MTSPVPRPYFPLPPATYSQPYMAEVVRAFSVYVNQAQNPGDAVFNTLNLLALPVYADNTAATAGGLKEGDVYRTSTGDLKIVYV